MPVWLLKIPHNVTLFNVHHKICDILRPLRRQHFMRNVHFNTKNLIKILNKKNLIKEEVYL